MTQYDDQTNIHSDIKDVTKRIIKFSNSYEFRELDAFYKRKSNFEVLGIHRNEIRHSRFIAWLLDPLESHNLGTFGLKKFIEVCVLNRLASQQSIVLGVPVDLLDEMIVGRVSIINATVNTELVAEKHSRIDLHVDCTLSIPNEPPKKLWILIENKVNSTEHDSQTNRYRDWIDKHKNDYDYSLLVYLTPIPTLKLMNQDFSACKCKSFLQINYQYLVDYLIEPALTLAQPGQAREFISDYLRALSLPSVIIAEQKSKGDLIMAIPEHERKLLTAFWEKHKSLVLAACYAISSDPNQEDDVREEATTVLQSLGTKDYSQYTVILNGKVVARNIKKTAIGREICRALIATDITIMEFEMLKADGASGFPLLKQEFEITDSEHKYNRYRIRREDPLEFQGNRYYACGNWGKDNIPRFQKFLAKKFPRIELRKQEAEPENSDNDNV